MTNTAPDDNGSTAISESDQAKSNVQLKRVYNPTPSHSPATPLVGNVMNEEDYAECLRLIIERDFYPDLPRLRLLHRLNHTMDPMSRHRLQRALDTLTPVTLPPTPSEIRSHADHSEYSRDCGPSSLPLNDFQSSYIPEDAASFDSIHRSDIDKQALRESWIERQTDLANINRLNNISNTEKGQTAGAGGMIFPHAQARNILMFPPPAAPRRLPPSAISQIGATEGRRTAPKNSRFPTALQDGDDAEAAAAAADRLRAAERNENEELHKMIQKGDFEGGTAAHFGILHTPTLLPGDNTVPLMTWGELGGTPLSVADTPGPGEFRIPDPSPRDIAGRNLYEKNTKSSSSSRRKRTLKSLSASAHAGDTPSRRRFLEGVVAKAAAAGATPSTPRAIPRATPRD
eukprot:GHVO01018375.1.p1 GENE.GHVO01018375.1~~GHVO01018375.1.p1  ORF type:complete len:401 (-),score=51.30 GHVO01018375.1:120-1322(-)